jgi:hypothetical protein
MIRRKILRLTFLFAFHLNQQAFLQYSYMYVYVQGVLVMTSLVSLLFDASSSNGCQCCC